MAKRVAVIDIGSNSVRMVIYEKTSRFAFHLLYETKTKVRLSQDIYQNNGYLQDKPMKRAYEALKDFSAIIQSFKVRKTLCVATSALRDAPNRKDFINRIKRDLKLNIKIIDGEKEAYFGAIACANLLVQQQKALTIDIGGGSTEFSIINDKNISNNISLHLGTVRLKELFFDNNKIDEAIQYIDNKLEVLNNFNINSIVGIGGTFRAIAISIMKAQDYPLKKIHGFEFDAKVLNKLLTDILEADENKLKELNIKKNRYDIIKPGTLILSRIMKKFKIQNITASGVGVREGVYLNDLLRNSKDKMPVNYNTSMRYILDIHVEDLSFSNQLSKLTKELFDLTYKKLNLDKKYRTDLAIAAKLYTSGSNIHFYTQYRHSYHLVSDALEYGFSHKQITLIATLVKYAGRKSATSSHLDKFSDLLPKRDTLDILNYILSLSIALLSHRPRNIDFELSLKGSTINIDSKNSLYLVKDALNKLEPIKEISVKVS